MPRCADPTCGRWRPERLGPSWSLGFRLNGQWYCSRACLDLAVRDSLTAPAPLTSSAAALPRLRLGVLLRHLGVLSREHLDAALEVQRGTGLRLGAQLRALGLVAPAPIVKALAAQAGVSYLTSFDVSRVRGCGALPVATVRALGLVPFEHRPEDRSMSVVCTAPVPRAALRALTTLTGWSASAYLVDDAVWDTALDTYRPAVAARAEASGATVCDEDAVVARVLDAAGREGAVTLRHAACADYTWVRLEGDGHVSDWLMTGRPGEGPCQAAATAH